MSRKQPRSIRDKNASRWRDLVQDYRSSPLTQRAFCTKHDIAVSSFTRWCRRLADVPPEPTAIDAAAPANGGGFVAVRLAPSRSPLITRAEPTLSLELPNGLRVENISASNVAVVAALVEAL